MLIQSLCANALIRIFLVYRHARTIGLRAVIGIGAVLAFNMFSKLHGQELEMNVDRRHFQALKKFIRDGVIWTDCIVVSEFAVKCRSQDICRFNWFGASQPGGFDT